MFVNHIISLKHWSAISLFEGPHYPQLLDDKKCVKHLMQSFFSESSISIKTTFQSYIRSTINSALFQYLKSGCLFSDLKCKITTSHCWDNLLINSKRWKIRRNELKEQLSTFSWVKKKKKLFKKCNCMRWSPPVTHNNECVICTFWYVAWEHKIVIYYNFCAFNASCILHMIAFWIDSAHF